jgi:hypothetical protein
VERDEIVAFIAAHILSRYDFAVQTANSADALMSGHDGFDTVVVGSDIAVHTLGRLDPARTVVLGDGVNGLKPFAQLRKPLELDQLVATVTACANRR